MAEHKNKKGINVTSMNQVTLSLKSTNINSKYSGSSSSKSACTLSLSNKNSNLVLKIQTESSEKQRQTKPITAGVKNSSHTSNFNSNTGQKKSIQASNAHHNSYTGQKNTPHHFKAQPSYNSGLKNLSHPAKSHPNSNSEPKKAPHTAKTHSNLNSGQKHSPHVVKTHPNLNSGQKNYSHSSNSYPNSNAGQKQFNHAFKTHPNFNSGQKNHPSTFKTQSNFNPRPQSSLHAIAAYSSWSTGHHNFHTAFATSSNFPIAHESSQAAFKAHPNFNHMALSNSPGVLREPWDSQKSSDRNQYQIKDDVLKEQSQRPRHNMYENTLNCPTCKQIYSPQIYQCPSGHSTCSNCKKSGSCCGICNQAITDMRNFALEEFLTEKKFLCPHNMEGCKLSIKIPEMAVHIKECSFGMLECPACPQKMLLKQLSGHFEDRHPGSLAGVGSEVELRYIYEPSKKIYLIHVNDLHFVFHEWNMSPEDRRIYMAAQLIGTKVTASKWYYEVQIYNKAEPHRNYIISETCTSFVEPVAEVFKKGNCCILTQTQAVTFLNRAAVNYKIFIKKIVDNKPENEIDLITFDIDDC